MVLGLDALQTGKKVFPLSVSIVIFSALGSRLISRFTPRQIVRSGQLALVGGSLLILGSIDPQMRSALFAVGLLVLGAGLGLLASQIGNVTMSSVSKEQTSEVGGLQGTFQNIGASLGTALIGSIMITSLTTSFVNGVANNPSLPNSLQTEVSTSVQAAPIVPAPQIEAYAIQSGLSETEAESISQTYLSSQIASLKNSMFFIVVLGLASIALSRNIPNKKLV